jgi:hypothetical protein
MNDKLENTATKLLVRLLSFAELMTWTQFLSAIPMESGIKIKADVITKEWLSGSTAKI